jgi:hypothetical protein
MMTHTHTIEIYDQATKPTARSADFFVVVVHASSSADLLSHFVPSTTSIMILTHVAAVLLLLCAFSDQFQLCGEGKGGYVVSAPDLMPCKTPVIQDKPIKVRLLHLHIDHIAELTYSYSLFAFKESVHVFVPSVLRGTTAAALCNAQHQRV